MNEYNDQVELLKKIWFTKYARHWTGLCKCSCAFENIFMAELKSSDVLGKLCSHHLLQDKSLQVPMSFSVVLNTTKPFRFQDFTAGCSLLSANRTVKQTTWAILTNWTFLA